MATTHQFRVKNMDCENEAAAIRRGLDGLPGIQEIKVYPSAAKVALTYDERITSVADLSEKLENLGFPPETQGEDSGPPAPWRNPKVVTSACSGVLLLIGWIASAAGVPTAF